MPHQQISHIPVVRNLAYGGVQDDQQAAEQCGVQRGDALARSLKMLLSYNPYPFPGQEEARGMVERASSAAYQYSVKCV